MKSKVSIKRAMEKMTDVKKRLALLAQQIKDEKEKTPPNDGVKPVSKETTT